MAEDDENDNLIECGSEEAAAYVAETIVESGSKACVAVSKACVAEPEVCVADNIIESAACIAGTAECVRRGRSYRVNG